MQYNITYREKDGSWQYIISYKDKSGRWKQKSKQGFELTRKGKQSAKEAAENALAELKLNTGLIVPEEFKGITFKSFGKEYLEHTKIYRAFKTVQSTQTTLNKFSNLDNLELSRITSLDVQRIIDSFVKEGLSQNTINYYIKKLKIIFASAQKEYKIINSNPVLDIKSKGSTKPNKIALTDLELGNLLQSFKGHKYYLIILIAAYTGMRIGEILGLKWSDIDSKGNYITVERQWERDKNGIYGFNPLKSKNSYRKIPITKEVCSEILTFKTVVGIDNRIFGFKNKSSIIRQLNKNLKKRGFNISIHELRHTYATKLIANGMDFKTAANILGHDVQQTIKAYSHVNDDMLLKAKTLIEKIF